MGFIGGGAKGVAPWGREWLRGEVTPWGGEWLHGGGGSVGWGVAPWGGE